MEKTYQEEYTELNFLKECALSAENRCNAYGFLATVYNQMPDDAFVSNILNTDLDGLLAVFDHEDQPQSDQPQSDQPQSDQPQSDQPQPDQPQSDQPQSDNTGAYILEGLLLIKDYIEQSREKTLEDIKIEMGRDRTRLFRGIKSGYGPPPPYESVYVGTDENPSTQASLDVRQAYTDADAKVPKEVKELPDYIGIELDFMRHLTQKEVYAWEEDQTEQARELLNKQHRFLRDHLARWAPLYCEKMYQKAEYDFHRGIARLTSGFVLHELERMQDYLT